MVNNVHKPPDSYLTQIMYGDVFAFFYHTLPYHGMFKDTLLGYLWQHKQCKNRHPGLQASIKLLSFSHSSRYCAGVYLPLSHFYEALSCDKRHWVASFTVSCWVQRPSCDPSEALEEKKRMRRESAKKVAELQAFVGLFGLGLLSLMVLYGPDVVHLLFSAW